MICLKNAFCVIAMFIEAKHAVENVNLNVNLRKDTVPKLSDDGLTFYQTSGYRLDTSEQCIPICHRPCINGFYKAPNLFECNEGYKMKENECVPICKENCINEYCSKQDVCVCHNRFKLDYKNKTKCLPICVPKCENFSKCMKSLPPKPNHCQCNEGYVTNETMNQCKPYCIKECHNGFCIATETCSCKIGFEFHHVNKTNCIPKCEQRCQTHSSCIAHNVCACDNGYNLNKVNNICEPICRDQIEKSRCIKPPNTWICIENYQHDRRIDKCVLEYCSCNINGYCLEHKNECVCYDGFTKNITSGQCEPQCQPFCENSNCVANNICECLDEYHKTRVAHVCERNDFCNGHPCKNGECLITGECRCKAGFVKSLSYTGQIQCDIIQKFVGKLMTIILGAPVLLICTIFIVIYTIAKKKSYDVEEQEMILTNRN